METTSRSPSRTILLVDDDRDTLFLFRQILQQQGFQVLFARGGEDALKISKMHVGPLDLLITDVVMPGMSGQQLAERIKTLRPSIGVLYISGIMNASAVGAGSHFLSKPFTAEQLVGKIQELLPAA